MSEDAEIWRAIPSLPEYIASSHGRLMCLPWGGRMPHGGVRPYGGKPTTGVWSPEDNRFILQYRGTTYKVARLVCEAFHGSAPTDKPVCMHLDEDSRNNRPANLAWGSQRENMNAPGYLKRIAEQRPHGPKRILTPIKLEEVFRRNAQGESLAALAKEFGVKPCTLSNLRRRIAA